MPHRFTGLAPLALCLSLAGSPLVAATASLVADVNATTRTGPQIPLALLAPFGDRVLFTSVDASQGSLELWVSDGTDAGTRSVLATSASTILPMGSAGGFAYFKVGSGGKGGYQVWRTDGTRVGTFALQAPTTFSSDSTPLGGTLFFNNCGGDTCQLWKTDGTVAGTMLVSALPVKIPSVPDLLTAGKVLYLRVPADSMELWRSDGTAAGTVQEKTIQSVSDLLGTSGNRLLFAGRAAGVDSEKIWVEDGGVGGPRPLIDLGADARVHHVKTLGNTTYFLVFRTGGRSALWVTDGTSQGTIEVADLGISSVSPDQLEKIGNRILFVTGDTDQRIWTSDGTKATAAPLVGCPGGCPTFKSTANVVLAHVGNRVLFAGDDPAHGNELWETNGFANATDRVSDFCPGTCDGAPLGLTTLLGQGYFIARTRLAANGSTEQSALFRNDGTAGGTKLLTTFDGRPPFFLPTAAGGKVFFVAPDGLLGDQLWASDGTAAGTNVVTLVGVEGSSSQPTDLVALGQRLLWTATDGSGLTPWASGGAGAERLASILPSSPKTIVPGLAGPAGLSFFVATEPGGTSGLWRTDGTAANTLRLAVAPGTLGDLTAFSGNLLFTVTDSQGAALWASDGTVVGTAQRFRLPTPGVGPFYLTGVGADLYFVVRTGAAPADRAEIWKSDGTLAGTRLVYHFDDSAKTFDRSPRFTRVGSNVLFLVRNGNAGPELWRTDGSAAGTGPVLGTPGTPGTPGAVATSLYGFGGAAYFLANAHAGDALRGLWRTDGTAAGTTLLLTLAASPNPDTENPFFTPFAGRLYFAADDGAHGSELWRTDGTTAGTVLVRDIQAGAEGSGPASLVAADAAALFFSADDGEHGVELWQSDGTTAGTRMVQDLAPGLDSSVPKELTVTSDRLFFTADDGIFGREVWSYPLAAGLPACQPSATVLCLRGGRFQVTAQWHDFNGHSGPGQALPLTGDTGTFWFFDPSNLEVIVKVLDGQSLNGHFWAFYGALSNVEYTLTVTDTQTGATRRYLNPSGHFGSVGDTQAFGPLGATGSKRTVTTVATDSNTSKATPVAETRILAPLTCTASAIRLCLTGGRFAVEASWRDFEGHTGVGTAVPLTSDTGYFWFFDPANVEVLLKVLDGRALNGHFWVFYGALSNVEYTLTVTDVVTGTVRTYQNPSGRFGSVGDTGAF